MDSTDPRVPGYSGRAAATAGTAPHEKKRKKHKKPKKRKKQVNNRHLTRLAPKKWVATLLASGVPRGDIIMAFSGKSPHRYKK